MLDLISQLLSYAYQLLCKPTALGLLSIDCVPTLPISELQEGAF